VNIDVLYAVSIWLLPVLIAVTFHEAIWKPWPMTECARGTHVPI